MQKRRIMLVSLVVAIVVIAIVSYEFFEANSLSGYTKITLTPEIYPPYSIKFGNTSYYMVYVPIGKWDNGPPTTPPDHYFQITTEPPLNINLTESFRAIQGAKYSFDGLRIVVNSVNGTNGHYQLVLYVKSTISSSEPIISPTATPPTPYPPPYNIVG